MKFFTLFPALCLFLSVTGAQGEEKMIQKFPSVFVPAPTHEFEPIIDGTEVFHDFIILNKGTALLEIEKVKAP